MITYAFNPSLTCAHTFFPKTTTYYSPQTLTKNKSTLTTMRPHLLTMAPNNHHSSSAGSSSLFCRHSPSATLDILILILVLFSGTFLVSSYVSYIFQSMSLLLPSLSDFVVDTPVRFLGFGLVLFVAVVGFWICCCGRRSRKCGKLRCKGMKKAMEFDLQIQTEECLRSAAGAVKEVDELPWKGGTEGNPDYECLRAELKKMAPPNGRAVLLFRAKCGCPVAKLEGWGLKRSRRHKKALATNGGDHR